MPAEGAPGAAGNHRLMSPKATISVLNSVLGAILGTAALIFIAQNMGPTVLGTLAFALAFVGVLSFMADFGIGSVHSMFIRKGEDIGKCIGAYAVIKAVLLVIFSVATVLLIELWRRDVLGGSMAETHALADTMYVFLIYYVLLGISQIATHTFDGVGAVAKVHVPAIIEIIVRVSFIIFVATSALGSDPEGPAFLASAYAGGILAATLLASVLLGKYRVSTPDRRILNAYIHSLAPVFVVSMIIILDLFIDKLLVGYFSGEYELGLYFGVQKMAIFVSVFSLSVATLILPSVTTYFMRKDVAASWEVVNRAERYVSLVVIPTAAFYLMWGSQILSIFLTPEFADNVRTMDLLVIGSTVFALVLPLRSAIVGVGKHSTLFYIGLGGLALQLALILILVPDTWFGMDSLGMKGLGAAVALLVTSVYYFFVLRYMAWRTAKILPNSGSFKHVIAALVMVGVMYVVNWMFLRTIDFPALILLAVVGAVVYGAAAYVLGELEASDYRYFRSMLNPQDTMQYVVNELLGKRSQ